MDAGRASPATYVFVWSRFPIAGSATGKDPFNGAFIGSLFGIITGGVITGWTIGDGTTAFVGKIMFSFAKGLFIMFCTSSLLESFSAAVSFANAMVTSSSLAFASTTFSLIGCGVFVFSLIDLERFLGRENDREYDRCLEWERERERERL